MKRQESVDRSLQTEKMDGWLDVCIENKEENIDQKSGKNCHPFPFSKHRLPVIS